MKPSILGPDTVRRVLEFTDGDELDEPDDRNTNPVRVTETQPTFCESKSLLSNIGGEARSDPDLPAYTRMGLKSVHRGRGKSQRDTQGNLETKFPTLRQDRTEPSGPDPHTTPLHLQARGDPRKERSPQGVGPVSSVSTPGCQSDSPEGRKSMSHPTTHWYLGLVRSPGTRVQRRK